MHPFSGLQHLYLRIYWYIISLQAKYFFYRTILTCVFLHLLFFKHINPELLRAIKNKELLALSVIGTIALFLQTVSLKYTTASNCAFITAFSAILVPIIKFIHYKTHIKKMFLLAVGIAIGGIYLISYGPAIPSSLNL